MKILNTLAFVVFPYLALTTFVVGHLYRYITDPYGWNAKSVKIIEEHLTDCGIPVVAEGVTAKWQPRPDDLAACEKLGRTVAEAITAR